MRDVPIRRIMTTHPATIGPDEPAARAREMLSAGAIHHLPVVEAGILAGIVSSSDLLKLFLLDGGADDAGAAVKHIMERDPLVLPFDANLRDAAIKLSVGGFHSLPIVEPDRTLVGIVTSSDLIGHLLHQIPRGDGSLRPSPSATVRHATVSDDDIRTALQAAEAAVERADDRDAVGRVLLHVYRRNRQLREVCRAAELYVRSGHSEHEHSVLIKRLADAREAADTTL